MEYLIWFYPILMKIILGIIIFLFIYNFKILSKFFKKIPTKTWVLLLLIFLSGLIIRVWVIPHTHYVYYDEFEHVNIAQNIFLSNQFCKCNIGDNKECDICILRPWPPGYHIIQSFIFNFFGDFEEVAFNTNAVIASFTIILFFLLVYLFTKNNLLSLIGAFLFNLIPGHVKFSGSSSLSISSIFFVILSMIFLEIYIKRKKYSLLLLFFASLLYTIQIRPENIFLLLIFIPYLFIRLNRNDIKHFINVKYILAIFIFLLFLIPFFQLIYYGYSPQHSPGWDEPLPTRIDNFNDHFFKNIIYFIHLNFNSIILLPLSFLGIIGLYTKDRKNLIYLSLFFLLFFCFYTSYHIGLFYNVEGGVRYSLMLYIPLLLVVMFGIQYILKNIRINNSILILVILLLYILSLIPTIDFINRKSELESQYRFILSMKEKIPNDIYVLSHSPPSIISTINKKSISVYYLLNSMDYLKHENNVILFQDFWWYKRMNESEKIENLLKEKYSFKLIEESEGYGFYNLTLK